MMYIKQTILVCVVVSLASAAIDVGRPDACLERPVTGRCRAAHVRYFFNADTGACECFLFGGCGGGANRFRTLQGCMNSCGVSPSEQSAAPECRYRPGATRP